MFYNFNRPTSGIFSQPIYKLASDHRTQCPKRERQSKVINLVSSSAAVQSPNQAICL